MFLDRVLGQKAPLKSDYDGPEPPVPGVPRRRISPTSAKVHLQAYGGKDAIDWVMDCVEVWTTNASLAEYHFEKDGETQIKERSEAEEPYQRQAPQDLQNLIAHPNPWTTWEDLLEVTIISYLLTGNAYWLKWRLDPETGKPLALYALPADRVTIVPAKDSRVDRYEYQPEGAAVPLKYSPDEVVHFKRPNPHSDYVGLGVIAGGPRVYDTELALVEHTASYLERGTSASGLLKSKRVIPKVIFDRIRAQFMSRYSGPKKAGEVIALERDIDFEALTADAEKAELVKLASQSQDRICSAFRVSKVLMGNVGSADRLAVREAQRIFDNKVLRPFLNRFQKKVTAGVTSAWGIEFKIDYKFVTPIEDRMELAATIASVPGVRVREVREFMELEPLGDDRDEIVLNLPGDDENASTIKDRNLPGEAGRPPDPENTAAFPAAGNGLPKDAAAQAKAILKEAKEKYGTKA